MSNKSRFLAALEQIDDAKAKLAALDAKVATLNDIYHRAPMVDPLDNPQYGPASTSSHAMNTGNLGSLLGGAAGAALGGWGGHELAGTAGMLGGAAAGGLGGHALGKSIGHGIGAMMASPEEQMAEHIKHLDPASGLAHLRMLEASGKVSPTVLQAGKDAYNTRRSGIQTQLGAGVAVPPGRIPVNTHSTRPEPLPV